MRWCLDEDSPWLYDEDGDPVLTFRNDYIDSGVGQFDMSGSVPGLTDGSGEFETYPWDHPTASTKTLWYINETMCGHQGQPEP